MTGEKRTETRMRCYNALVYSLYITPPLPWFVSNFERAIAHFFIFVNRQCTNGHGVIIVGVIGSRFATLLHHSLVQLHM